MKSTLVISEPLESMRSKLSIYREDGAVLVVIDMNDGTMTFHEDYKPDEAAKIFWAAVTTQIQMRPVFLAGGESHG